MTQDTTMQHLLFLLWNGCTRFLADLTARYAALDANQHLWAIGLGLFGSVMILLYDKIITYDFVQGQIRAGRATGEHGWVDNDPHAPWNFFAAVLVGLITFSVYVLLTH